MPLLECVPNFSEGRDRQKIQAIADAITSVDGVQLLHIDAGHAANRTVMTFVGKPEKAAEAAFQAIQKAAKIIDMTHQKGEHPRMGATDVCPLVPISGFTLKEAAELSVKLAKRVGDELNIPVYLYEASATKPLRKNLASIRKGEYEGLAEKMRQADWQPDFGPSAFQPKTGATVIGARPFLIAYNINLDTVDDRLAWEIAYDIRETGRIKKGADGKNLLDKEGKLIRIPGSCKSVKAIGWYIEEFGKAQVSMNLTNLEVTVMHEAFEACMAAAKKYNVSVTGSELVGLVPKNILLKAGRFYAPTLQNEKQLIEAAVDHLGLDELAPFDPQERILEYRMIPKNPTVFIISKS